MGADLPLTQPDGSIPPTSFLRVAVEDIDIDGDTLTNAEEHAVGSSPYFADTNSKGVPDGLELHACNNPSAGMADGNGDGNPDNEIYSVEFEATNEHHSIPTSIGRVQDKKVQGAAKRVRREDEMTMTRPFGPRIGSSSAWADTFRPSLGPTSDHFMSRITFLSRTRIGHQALSGIDNLHRYLVEPYNKFYESENVAKKQFLEPVIVIGPLGGEPFDGTHWSLLVDYKKMRLIQLRFNFSGIRLTGQSRALIQPVVPVEGEPVETLKISYPIQCPLSVIAPSRLAIERIDATHEYALSLHSPDWQPVEEHFGNSVPKVLKRFYADPKSVLLTNFDIVSRLSGIPEGIHVQYFEATGANSVAGFFEGFESFVSFASNGGGGR